ncbi:AfsR/SARP family transcriptional regulator [Planomonospora parontospora]|uniref:AfsR/SARP family transcriptional regulator n=1 Tax=Planomonospora parontospora TaxID=58119 RepID=UPI00166FD0A5|nr:BTAD domain-containing putative transcriptional regulator [Planomonospora parontospora]GGL03674.1 SARP family transcriptional regulator [Planomonospora parontospora subsp. antibiotica]GII13386.1 SARP family transcriptional regulator [Planomonospora parontospora subsp. antibiotica]
MLGVLTVRRTDGGLVPLRRRKHRQLLVTLLLKSNASVSTDHLVESLWEAAPPPSAEQNLKTYVHTLRKLLSPDDPRSAPIKTHGTGYLIALEPDDLDLLVFQDLVRQGRRASLNGDVETACRRLEQARGLWRGDPLQDSRGSRFLDEAADRLAEEGLSVLEDLAELRLRLGRHLEAISDLRSAIAAYPLRERLWQRLMLALHRSGDRVGALEAYQRFRKVLVEETGLEPGRQVQELHQRILTSGSETGPVPSAGASQPSEARPAPPRQLPRDLTGFVGRTEELVRLRSLLVPWDGSPPHHVTAITGPPGSGKSALAVRAAHAVGRDFPDGLLYTDLHGATPGLRRLEPLEVLGRFLRDLGVSPQAVPDDVDEAAALWRSTLDGRKVLVVLDDAADLAQIRPMLSVPVGSAILVTSRESFALVGDCARVRIGELRRTEASAMFAKLIGAERAAEDLRATGRLIELCGGLPLAVGIAGARLANRPRWAVADLVARLEDERRRLHELEAGDLAVRSSLAVSYDLLAGGAHPLDRLAARTLRMLGVLQVADVTAHVVGALLGEPADLAERALERLVDAHLVECDEPGRYRLHDLVRLFAREQSALDGPEANGAALNRALKAYIATAHLAIRLGGHPVLARSRVEPGENPAPLTSECDADTWLGREWANLMSAASQAMERSAEKEGETVRLGANLVFAFFWYTLYRGLRTRTLAISHEALRAGQRLGDPLVEALGHNHLADAYTTAYRYAKAAEHYEEQLVLYRRLADPWGEQRALGGLANAYSDLQRYEEAIRCAGAQLVICEAIGHGSGECFSLLKLGEALHRAGRSDQALSALDRALQQSRIIGNLRYEASVFEKLGDLHLDLNDPLAAKNHYETGLALSHAAKMTINEPYQLLGLARSCRLLGELDQAELYATRSLDVARTMEDHVLEELVAKERSAILTAREETGSAVGEVSAR